MELKFQEKRLVDCEFPVFQPIHKSILSGSKPVMFKTTDRRH